MCHHVCRLSITIALPIVAKGSPVFTIVAKRVSCVYNCCQTGPLVFTNGGQSPNCCQERPPVFTSGGQKRQYVRICARVQIVEAAQKIDLTMHLSQSGLGVFRAQASGEAAKVSLEADLTG